MVIIYFFAAVSVPHLHHLARSCVKIAVSMACLPSCIVEYVKYVRSDLFLLQLRQGVLLRWHNCHCIQQCTIQHLKLARNSYL